MQQHGYYLLLLGVQLGRYYSSSSILIDDLFLEVLTVHGKKLCLFQAKTFASRVKFIPQIPYRHHHRTPRGTVSSVCQYWSTGGFDAGATGQSQSCYRRPPRTRPAAVAGSWSCLHLRSLRRFQTLGNWWVHCKLFK